MARDPYNQREDERAREDDEDRRRRERERRERMLDLPEWQEPAPERLPIIGRDRALIDKLTTRLHDAARKWHNYGAVIEDARGSHFEVQLLVDGEPTGRVARVTVELDRVEP